MYVCLFDSLVLLSTVPCQSVCSRGSSDDIADTFEMIHARNQTYVLLWHLLLLLEVASVDKLRDGRLTLNVSQWRISLQSVL